MNSQNNQFVTSGISGLDMQMGGGIPPGTVLLLIADSGDGAEIFTKQFMYGGLESGEEAFYFSSDHSILDIKTDMNQFGWDIEQYEKEGKAEFIDAYTPRLMNILPFELKSKISVKEFIKHGSDPLNQLRTAIYRPRNSKYRGIIDSISYFLKTYDINSVIEVIELMSNISKLTNSIHLIPIGVGLHDDVTLSTMKYLADGVIELFVKERGSQIERGMVIRKMRGIIVPSKNMTFKITNNGIELETTTRVL